MDDLLKLKVTRTSDWHSEHIKISKGSKVSMLKAKALRKLGLRNNEAQIWDYYNGTSHGLLEHEQDRTLESARIIPDQEILLQQKVNGVFPDNPSTRPRTLALQGLVERGSSATLSTEDRSLSMDDASVSSDEELQWMQEEVQTMADGVRIGTPAKYTLLHIALLYGQRVDKLRTELKEERDAHKRVEEELAAEQDTVRNFRAAFEQMGRAFRANNS